MPIKFCKAWKANDISIWEEFGHTNLTFLEYLLIGIGSSLFPNDLLNKEGKTDNYNLFTHFTKTSKLYPSP